MDPPVVDGEAVPTEYPDRIGEVAARELARNGYARYEQLTIVTSKELLALHGIGPKTIRILDEELRARGLSFAATGDRASQSLAPNAGSGLPHRGEERPFGRPFTHDQPDTKER